LLEWATVDFVAALKWFFPQPLKSCPDTRSHHLG
jgi:hypothetical protein